ncbi:MAG: NADH-quinone oxidoreductase subunit N, partial [Planctomycetota bacterium]
MTSAIPLADPLPELILLIAGCAVLLLGQSASARRHAPWAALGGLVLALAIVLVRADEQSRGSGLLLGPLAFFVRLAALEIGIILVLINWYESRPSQRGEYLAMLLFALAGLLLVGAADNLFILFLALELVSFPTYVMVAISRDEPAGLEAGTKYFFLGALSAALMAYGFSLLYGVAGTAQLTAWTGAGGLTQSGAAEGIAAALRTPGTLAFGLALAGLVLALGGLLFKIAAVPLHFYIADVYQGAASPVAGVLGFVPKLAGFVALFRIIGLTGYWSFDFGLADMEGAVAPVAHTTIYWLLWVLAALTMTIGNVLAIRQTNVKRLLGYSGIAHSGYMLVGVLAGPFAASGLSATTGMSAGGLGLFGDGAAAVLFYAVVYGLANLCAFAVLGLLRVGGQPCETLRDVAGLIRRSPGPALLLVLAMFTLLSMPPTPGFWGKLGLFGSAVTAARSDPDATRAAWTIGLVVLGVLNSAIGAAYYLRVVGAVLLYENPEPA